MSGQERTGEVQTATERSEGAQKLGEAARALQAAEREAHEDYWIEKAESAEHIGAYKVAMWQLDGRPL